MKRKPKKAPIPLDQIKGGWETFKPSPPTHLFQKGQSGNPSGRTPGYISKREWMDKNISEETRSKIMQVAIDKAIKGKVSMIELILSRVLPPVANDDTVDISLKDKTHAQRGDEIFAALEEKRITPTQAHLLFATLCDNVKLVEMTEIVERIKKLEQSQTTV